MCGNFSKDEIDSLYKVIFSRRDVRSGFTGDNLLRSFTSDARPSGPCAVRIHQSTV